MFVNAVHPGGVSTNIYSKGDAPDLVKRLAGALMHVFLASKESGALTQLYAATRCVSFSLSESLCLCPCPCPCLSPGLSLLSVSESHARTHARTRVIRIEELAETGLLHFPPYPPLLFLTRTHTRTLARTAQK